MPAIRGLPGVTLAIVAIAMLALFCSTSGVGAAVQPDLMLTPTEGPPGTQVSASVSGFDNCGADHTQASTAAAPKVTFSWEGEVKESSPLVNGAAGAIFPVPGDAPLGEHNVTAFCSSDDRLSVTKTFTVTTAAPTAAVPIATFDPETAPPGTVVTAVVTGYANCYAREAALLWDDVELKILTVPGTSTFRIPEDASFGSHNVETRCLSNPEWYTRQLYTVTRPLVSESPRTNAPVPPRPQPTAEPAPTGLTGWWPVALTVLLGGAVLSLLALRALRGRRDRIWMRTHVRAAPGSPAHGRIDITEAPVDSSPPAVTVRIEPHADRGTQVLEEVDQ